jgi:hypothetical protein
MGERFGVSHRTAHRWDVGTAYPSVDQVQQLARAVFPLNEGLAQQLAQASGTSLEALGLKKPPVLAPPVRPYPPVALVVDSIVHACMEVTEGQTPMLVVREILRAAFARARALGLRLEEVDEVLSPPSAQSPVKTRK